jgi:two-component system response regulator
MAPNTNVDILMVEDDPGDVELTREGFRECALAAVLHVVEDGIEALRFLRRQGPYREAVVPDLILLDLNLPRMDGRELLRELRADDSLKAIPVVVLTTSEADTDIFDCYRLGANCYLSKPVRLDDYLSMVQSLGVFWFSIAHLPNKGGT